ncbi:MAG: hypothetical protein WC692_03220 [Erythrobacter sp.]|jgi:hypothetical protein
MVLGLLFVCGVLNFALGKAMLESGHPVVASLPPALRRGGVSRCCWNSWSCLPQ